MATESESIPRQPEQSASGRGQKSASGSARTAAKKVTFTYDNPSAQTVTLTGSFCGWQPNAYPLAKNARGVWKVVLSLPRGRHEYRFVVDGQWTNDPRCAEVVGNEFGSENCVLTVE
ncbi:isoamylase early set domain-containing protein [Salinispira pacifica]